MRNYFDDDEELQLYAPLLTEMPQPQGPAPMQQPMQRDPELDAAWSDRQRAALEASYPNQSYGVGEFARDNGAALLAMALDAGFNKGRGLANIVAGTAQEVGSQKAYRDKQAQAQADIAIRMRGRNVDPYAQQLAAQRLAVSQQNAGTNAQRVSQTQQRFEAQGDPESAHSKGRVVQQERLAGAGATGRLNAEHELNPQTAEDKAAIRTAETQAEIDTRHGSAPQLAADEAAKRAAVAQAELPTQQALKQTVTPSDARASKEADRAAADQFTKETAYDRGQAQTLDRIDRVISKYREGELPGVGFAEGFGGDLNTSVRGMLNDFGVSDQTDALELRNARNTLAELAQRKESGAAGPEAERARYLMRVGASPTATEAQFRVGLQAAKDYVRMNLAASSVGKEGMARQVLDAGGLQGWGIQAQQAAPAARPPGRQSSLAPAQTGELGAPRPVPPIPAQAPPAPGSAGGVRIRLGDEEAVVPPDVAQRLKAANPELEILQ